MGGARASRTWTTQDFNRARRSFYVDRKSSEFREEFAGAVSGAIAGRGQSMGGSDALKISLEV